LFTQAFKKSLATFLPPLFILLLVGPSKSQLPPETWAQFRGSHQAIGVSVSNVPKDLKLVWTYEAGESIESSAAIVNGAVYVGSQSGELAALNLADGSVRWKYKATGPIGESSPCVAGGVVFIGDLNGTLNAVSARDGKAVWAFKTNGEIKSSPVVVGDRVLVGSYDEHLYCVSVSNGSLIWKFRTGGPVHCTAGVSNGMAHIAGCDETFRAIRIADGKEVFHVASGAYTGASPALAGRRGQSCSRRPR
jgi:outer membrane protein assembly factor BamB